MFMRSREAVFAARFLLILLAAWAAFNWGPTIDRITQLYVTIPTWDYWRVAANASNIRALNFRYLWQQHNEHRIVGPDTVFAIDLLLFHTRRILPIVVSFACYFGCWLLIARSIAADTLLSVETRGFAITLAAIMIGWRGSALALADPFLIAWTLMEFAFLLALWLVSRAISGSASASLLASVIAFGFVATYSLGNGLLVWPVLVLAAYVCGWTKRLTGALAMSGLVADGLYFVGYRFGGNLQPATLFRHPAYTMAFIGSYLSMPFGGMKSPRFGVYVGVCQVAVMLLLVSVALRHKLLATRTGIVLFGSYLFTVLAALLTALGRMEPEDGFYTNAKATRYLTLVMINWGVCAAALLWLSARRGWRVTSPPLLAVVLGVLMAIGFLKLRWWERTGIRPYVDAQVTQLSVENGLQDPRLLRSIFPSPEFVEQYLKVLQADGLSIYSDAQVQPLKRVARTDASKIAGAITRVFPLQSGVEIVGWTRAAINRLTVVNEAGEAVGVGRRLPLGLPSELLTPDTPPSLAWIAFVRAEYAGGTFSVYSGPFQIGESRAFPQITAVNESQAGAAISSIEWRKDPAWTQNGQPPIELKGPAPRGPVYGSWSGADSKVGAIQSSSITVPDNRCLILPVLHGPSTKPLNVEVRDPAKGTILERLPMQDEDMQWEFWRIPIRGSSKVQIVASDQGRNDGEWLAIATPERCK